MYVLHGVPDWGSQVVRMALAELDQPFDFRPVDVQAGGLADATFLKLNPLGRIPVLETPDGTLFETSAILLYLAERHGQLAPAPGTPGRAAFLVWFIFVTNQLHPTVMTLLHPYRPGGEGAADAVAAVTHARLRDQLAALEAVAAAGHWWLSPDRPSVLSLFVVMLLRWIKAFPARARDSIDAAGYPALHRMAKGIERRPAIVAVLAAEGLAGPVFSDPPCETAVD